MKAAKDKAVRGGTLPYHLGAIFVVFVWGTTFIATKLLLEHYNPIEIMVVRFIIGFLTLGVFRPRPFFGKNLKEELTYLLTAFFGITLYYYLENTALTYTFAANVGIIIAAVPFFTGILATVFTKEKGILSLPFLVGFLMAMTGIVMISLNGASFHMNPLGDFLTVLAAVSWAAYTLLYKRIERFGYDSITSTKHVFFWGVFLTIPLALYTEAKEGRRVSDLFSSLTLRDGLLFLFLGVLACAICYILWNLAVERLGPVKTNLYIYLNPVTTLLAAWLVLKEGITLRCMVGTVLVLGGLLLSELPIHKEA